MSYYGFGPYVSVAKRRAKAAREMDKLKRKGFAIHPIEIEKRKITKTFWGNAWCEHIESFSDYINRLPRGRTYVRNGSVCHLAINRGCVEAIVSGSSLYSVSIKINPLSKGIWQHIKTSCAGKIGSLLDLLSGKLSDGVMEVVCGRENSLFPLSKEIKLSCDCPDWATMCKHVAAVLYGVGARLDHSPEKLFELRGVDHHELIDTSIIDITQAGKSQRRRIDGSDISDVFGIDLSDAPSPAKKTKATRSKSSIKPPKYFSGTSIRKKRKQLNLSQSAFAKRVGVCAVTIARWESQGAAKLNLSVKSQAALRALWL